MTPGPSTLRRLAEALPDIPRWLETRGLLLAGDAEVFGLVEGPAPEFVARDAATGLICVAGRPGIDSIHGAVTRSSGSREPLLCQADDADYVATLLPGWRRDNAILHLLASSANLPRLLVLGTGGMIAQPFAEPEAAPVPVDQRQDEVAIRFISTDELDHTAGIGEDLRRELTIALLRGRLAATIVNGVPASFCYAASLTESLWDVSVDTLEPFRRRGYAGLCVAYVIDQMNRDGRRPVWGAIASNAPSLRLASKLGFRPVDRLAVFERP